MITKICCFCGEEKIISEFQKDKYTPDGLTYRCAICRNNASKLFLDKRKKKIVINIIGGEKWQPIIGFNGLYAVSSTGRVKRIHSFCNHPKGGKSEVREKILKGTYNELGYLYVTLSNGAFKQRFFIHRLVALAFIQNPENKPEVNHKNNINDDNNLYNLEWSTRKENAEHYFTGFFEKSKLRKKIAQIDVNTGKEIRIFESILIAANFLGNRNRTSEICKCAKGIEKSCYGYKWEYR